jgi:hypothetical protein
MMLKYVKVDSDGYAYLSWEDHRPLHTLGYSVGRANDEWILYRSREGGVTGGVVFETTDHVLFDNYLKLLLED